jgi:hypothetical protein
MNERSFCDGKPAAARKKLIIDGEFVFAASEPQKGQHATRRFGESVAPMATYCQTPPEVATPAAGLSPDLAIGPAAVAAAVIAVAGIIVRRIVPAAIVPAPGITPAGVTPEPPRKTENTRFSS